MYYLTLTYYFILTVTLSIHGNSNMEALTSNKRMSAITIFLLYFDVDRMSLDHLCEEGLAYREDIEIPFHIIFTFSIILIFFIQDTPQWTFLFF